MKNAAEVLVHLVEFKLLFCDIDEYADCERCEEVCGKTDDDGLNKRRSRVSNSETLSPSL